MSLMMKNQHIPPRASVDGIGINMPNMSETIHAILDAVARNESCRVFTLNLDHLVKCRQNLAFRDIYSRAEIVTADGAPVAALARRQAPEMTRTTGADLPFPLAEAAAQHGYPIAFYGAKSNTLRQAGDAMQKRLKHLSISYAEAPPMGFDPRSEAARIAGERIVASGAKLVFIALGAPKQEFLADLWAEKHKGVAFICIGAALDFIAGEVQRSPAFFQNYGLEWLWRFLQEPRRLGKRYFDCALLLSKLLIASAFSPPNKNTVIRL